MKNLVALSLVLLVSVVKCRPALHNQRQDGETNVHAHLENLIFLYIPSSESLIHLKGSKDAAVGADEPRVMIETSTEHVIDNKNQGKDNNSNMSIKEDLEEASPHKDDSEKRASNENPSSKYSRHEDDGSEVEKPSNGRIVMVSGELVQEDPVANGKARFLDVGEEHVLSERVEP